MSFNEDNEHEEWREAMEEEYDSIMKNKTWELTELPKIKIPQDVNGYTNLNSKKIVVQINIKLDWWKKGIHIKRALIMWKNLHQQLN